MTEIGVAGGAGEERGRGVAVFALRLRVVSSSAACAVLKTELGPARLCEVACDGA